MNTGLQGKTALVTGGAGGIGTEICRALALEGMNLIVHCNKSLEQAEALAAELSANFKIKARAIPADLTNEMMVRKLYEEAWDNVGPIDMLVANAGYWPSQDIPIQEMTLQHWNQTLNVNLTSTFLTVRQFFKGIQKHLIEDPSLIMIGSTAGAFGEPMHADYAAAKSALMYGFAKSLKNEIVRIAPRGRVNVVAPGWTITKMAEDTLKDSTGLSKTLQTIALKKIARADEIARSVVYFASPALSSHVTGQVLMVDGGMEGRVLYKPNELDLTKA